MTTVTVRAIEVVQVIQNCDNDVPLVAGRPAWVRVYLSPGGLADRSEVSGCLSASLGSGVMLGRYRSLNRVQLTRRRPLAEQRLDWSRSLNFLLPAALLNRAGGDTLEVRLDSLTLREPGVQMARVTSFRRNYRASGIEIATANRLDCRILLLRHRDHDNLDYVEPGQGAARAVKAFVEAAFPVAQVGWSEVRVAAPPGFRALAPVEYETADTRAEVTRAYLSLFQQLLAIRECEVADGRAADSLYLGLIDDPGGRFGGAAMDSPQFPAPHAVAIAAPDSDGQLGAHELAHALGRRHPGVPDRRYHGPLIGQSREPGAELASRPTSGLSARGLLSNRNDAARGKTHIGIDCRSSPQAPGLLPHDRYFDLMTYREPQWVSDLTYKGLMGRLEDTARQGFAVQDDDCGTAGIWTVIGEYDLSRNTGRIFYCARGRYRTPLPPAPSRHTGLVKLGWETGARRGGPALATESVYIRSFDRLDGSASLGVFQHSLGLDHRQRDDFREFGGKAVGSAAARKRFMQSFANLVAGGGRLKLLIDGAVADEIAPLPPARRQALGTYFEQTLAAAGAAEPVADLRLEYSLADAGYYLRYHWRWPQPRDEPALRALTTIACRRRRQLTDAEDRWETIAVSPEASGAVWISPVFFDNPRDAADADTGHGRYGDYFFGGDVRKQALTVRIGVSTGFDHFCYSTVLRPARDASRAIVKRRDPGED